MLDVSKLTPNCKKFRNKRLKFSKESEIFLINLETEKDVDGKKVIDKIIATFNFKLR